MSISLLIGGKLWGLISCHGYGPPFRVSSPVREVCRALGNLASSNIERLIYAQRVQCINPFYTTAPSNSPSAYIAASSTDLLSIFSADFGFLAIKNEARVIGKLLAYPEAIAILRYLRYRAFTRVFYTNNIERDCADIGHQGGFKVISGLLVVPLTPLGTDFLVFMRKGVLKEVNWAGNPYLKEISEGNGGGPLEPRSSFRIWKEYVVGTSQVWTENEGCFLIRENGMLLTINSGLCPDVGYSLWYVYCPVQCWRFLKSTISTTFLHYWV
jgi:light-regulated signal transduction histidine kinase (bacteriophytochrome)